MSLNRDAWTSGTEARGGRHHEFGWGRDQPTTCHYVHDLSDESSDTKPEVTGDVVPGRFLSVCPELRCVQTSPFKWKTIEVDLGRSCSFLAPLFQKWLMGSKCSQVQEFASSPVRPPVDSHGIALKPCRKLH